MKKHLEVKIYGKVQGVFFRISARNEARNLKIGGLAENLLDGSVHIKAEGEEKQLEKFLKWCGNGPSKAVVEEVSYKFSDRLKNFRNFEAS